jgi:Amt family ammonium transporter
VYVLNDIATSRAAMSAFVTTISASCGALGWMLIDSLRERTMRFTMLGFCCGVLAGLVCITPGSGFVAPWASIIIGFIGGIVCNYGCQLKHRFHFDDALDAFGFNGVGGVTGCILTGIFAQKWVAALDGTVILGGLIDGNPTQIAYQLVEVLVCASYAFCLSCGILFIINIIPGLQLRTLDGTESDLYELGENAYEIINYS